MIKKVKFSFLMPIQGNPRLIAVVLCGLFAAGPITPAVAEPLFRDLVVDDPTAIELVSLPPEHLGGFGFPVIWFERQGLEPEASAEDAADLGEAEDEGAWEEAFAASTPLVESTPPSPDYSVVVNERVEYFLERFTSSRREVVRVWASRSGRYLGMIQEVLRQKGLPEDLAWTAMIESGFNPVAVSRAGAKGLWQFMAGTARRYGLRVDRWVDERFDPEKSTVAAADYLRDLYAIFGSWPLAQAAYNAGGVKVSRAIRLAQSNDFWALAETRYLRRETKDFVPQIHAATVIAREPARYGFDFSGVPEEGVEIVSVPRRTSLSRLASAAGLDVTRLRALNRELIRGVTPPDGTWELRVPADARDRILAALATRGRRPASALARVTSSRTGGVVTHVVRPNDTVSTIAQRYGVSVRSVLHWNGLAHDDVIYPGDRLRIAALPLPVEASGQGGFR